MSNKIMVKHICYLMLFLFFACKKQTINESVKWECASPQISDSTSAVNSLIGRWKLVAVGGGNVAGVKHEVEYVELVFNSDATYVVKADAQTSGSGTWHVTVLNGRWLNLEANPRNRYLNGSMVICEDKLSFGNSPADGLDFLFNKK